MTNADAILQALSTLTTNCPHKRWYTSREIMWQVRRDGLQMTTARARGIALALCRQGKADQLMDGKRYKFATKR